MTKAVVVSAARTPVGRFGGSFKTFSAPDLGAVAIKGALDKAGIEPEDVDDVVMGNALQTADNGYAARLSSLRAGVPEERCRPSPSTGSAPPPGGHQRRRPVHTRRRGGHRRGRGTENMSQTPYAMRKSRWDGFRMGNAVVEDLLVDGLSCPVHHYHMGVTAENVAAKFEVSREDQDELALESHKRAVRAIEEGRFTSTVPVSVPQRKADPLVVENDEQPRADATLERLSTLRPVFKEDGSVTAGNSSGINDGAAAVVLMSEEKAKELGLTPRAEWKARAVAGVDPALMGTGPVPAVRKLLDKTGMELSDIDLIELNEAFAAQALYCIREAGHGHGQDQRQRERHIDRTSGGSYGRHHDGEG